MYHVRATNGNTRIGGARFVDRLMEHCIGKIENTVLSDEELCSLRCACENAKKTLSVGNVAEIVIADTKISIDINEYGQLIMPFIEKTMSCVENALQDADLLTDEITKVILVGGGTYTPLVRMKLEKKFPTKVDTGINPMLAGNAFHSRFYFLSKHE